MKVRFRLALKDKKEVVERLWKETWRYVLEHADEIAKGSYDATPLIRGIMKILDEAGIKVTFEEAQSIIGEVLGGRIKPYNDDEAPPLTSVTCLFCGSLVILEHVGDGQWTGICPSCRRHWRLSL